MATGQTSSALGERVRAKAIERVGLSTTYAWENRARVALGRLSWRLRDVERPIFIWGTGKTGSYLLFDILSMHPDLICPRGVGRDNKGLYPGTPGIHDPLGYHELPYAPVEGAKRFILRPFPDAPTRATWTSEELDKIRRGYQELLGGSVRTRRLCDKAPHYVVLVPLLEQLFPDALHVRCLRHPYWVTNSYIRRMSQPGTLNPDGSWGTPPPGWAETADRSPTDRAAWLAIETLRTASDYAAALGDRCTTSTYESLTAAPREQTREILKRLGLRETPILPDALPETIVSHNSSLSSLEDVSPDLRESLDALTEDLGYAIPAKDQDRP